MCKLCDRYANRKNKYLSLAHVYERGDRWYFYEVPHSNKSSLSRAWVNLKGKKRQGSEWVRNRRGGWMRKGNGVFRWFK